MSADYNGHVTSTSRQGVFVERVTLVNYKSVASCDVALGPLTVVVGRNGSGKSNFLDSLSFVADALQTSLEQAIRSRSGIKAITNRLGGPRLVLGISLRFADGRKARYQLELDRGRVREEGLTIVTRDGAPLADFLRTGLRVSARSNGERLKLLPRVLHDRLALVTLSGLPEFRDAFDALVSMHFYRLNPEVMRELQDPDEGAVLRSDGSNIASVWRRLQKHPTVLRRLLSYLTVIVPEIKSIHPVVLGPKETLHFHQASAAGKRDLMFHASNMSDGTLRALGTLVAVRRGNGARAPSMLVGIEEPETALHPGAIAALMDALHEASLTTQIVVTSHSPDVLDHVDIETDALLVTELMHGVTTIQGVDGASCQAIRRHLYTPGDLLRMGQLQPAMKATEHDV